MSLTSEELYVKNIENGIRAIRLGVKAPKDTLAPWSLNKLKSVNEGLYEDYLEKYKNALKEYQRRNGNEAK